MQCILLLPPIYLSSETSICSQHAQPIQWVPGLSAGVKDPGRVAYHLPQSFAEVNGWSYTCTPIIWLRGM